MSLIDGFSQYTADENPSDEGLDNRSIISNRISQIKLEKENLKNALIDKGIDMENIPFTEYHNKINELKSEEINYPGYVLKTGTIYSTSGTGKSLTLSLPEGIIPLTGYMGSSFSVGALNENPVTIRHNVSTKMSNGDIIKTVFDSNIKGDGSSSSRYLNG